LLITFFGVDLQRYFATYILEHFLAPHLGMLF